MYQQSIFYNINTATKSEIIDGAQQYADKSFTESTANSRFNHTAYTAWNTSKLEEYKYIIRDRTGGGVHRFILTEEGKSVGQLIYNIANGLSIPENGKIIIKIEYKQE